VAVFLHAMRETSNPATPNVACIVYRCARQDELYLYLREDVAPDSLPEALLRQTGRLSEAMRLDLHEGRRLARVDVTRVIAALSERGFFLQLPPKGHMHGHLQDGD